MKFRCDCGMCLLEIVQNRSKRFPMVRIIIYDTYGKVKKLKKPELVADVVIMNNKYPKELTKLIKYFNKIKKEK